MIQHSKSKDVKEPKHRLERLLIFSTVIIAYYYIYVYQNMIGITVELISFNTLKQMPIMLLVIFPLIHYIVIKSDPLQRNPSSMKAIKFFQSKFPSKYIFQRCRRCIENENTCDNYIKDNSLDHVRYWFHDILHGKIKEENQETVRDTFEKGYDCKLKYYLMWILIIFIALALIIMIYYHIRLAFTRNFAIEVSANQILFPLVCAAIIVLIWSLNRVDDSRPSGCWQAWAEINGIHISWLEHNKPFLVNLICHNSNGVKEFKQK